MKLELKNLEFLSNQCESTFEFVELSVVSISFGYLCEQLVLIIILQIMTFLFKLFTSCGELFYSSNQCLSGRLH
jgi:hypothetical protein